ncbi:hypothetical protein Salat_2439100 [Sesamum alatum]|uniref:DUF4283 domain-containing protein n=1 Tax=Sesamum alatum TaxID=300844 RepID=A0AAE2CFL0_9LAMI|nr:hypothetical protein Salat_2439100 [Sesamum alatum]
MDSYSLSYLTHTTRTPNPDPDPDPPPGAVVGEASGEVDSASVEEGDRVTSTFKFPVFSSLVERVASDPTSMQTPERLRARWAASYGESAVAGSTGFGSTSSTIGVVADIQSSGMCTVAYGSLPRLLSHHPTVSLPPVRALFQGEGSSSSPPASREPSPTSTAPARDIYVGKIRVNPSPNPNADSITEGFTKSTRRVLHFVAPETQNGTVEVVETGPKWWQSTAVGYFLGMGPYFFQFEAFVKSQWPAVKEVGASSTGFYFIVFHTEVAVEEVIEGGSWLFQGQPIVLQKWQPGMTSLKQSHRQIPLWVKFRNLPMEYWTTEGLSVIASGVGSPLYLDAITRNCARVDYARVCVLVDISRELPKQLVLVQPCENSAAGVCRIPVEYE